MQTFAYIVIILTVGACGYFAHTSLLDRQLSDAVQDNLEQNLAASKVSVEHMSVDDDDDVIASVSAIVNTREQVQFEALYDAEHDVMIPLIDTTEDTVIAPLPGSSLEDVLHTVEQSDGTTKE